MTTEQSPQITPQNIDELASLAMIHEAVAVDAEQSQADWTKNDELNAEAKRLYNSARRIAGVVAPTEFSVQPVTETGNSSSHNQSRTKLVVNTNGKIVPFGKMTNNFDGSRHSQTGRLISR